MSDDQEWHAVRDTDGDTMRFHHSPIVAVMTAVWRDIILRANNLDLWIKMTDCLMFIPPITGRKTGK